MHTEGETGLTPVGRFSLALGAILAVTAILLSAGSAYLIGRWVVNETARSTEQALSTHIVGLFGSDVVTRALPEAERRELDGTGYPDRLAGHDIPLGARIFAVANSFDAMTSDRPYRRGRSLADARLEVTRHRGTQFDPAVVDAFLRVSEDALERVHEHAPYGLRFATAAS